MYKVTTRDVETGKTYEKEFTTEREALRSISAAELYDNLEVVSYSDNIDRSKSRH